MENLEKLVIELCKYKNETPWIEFKHDNYTPEMIGEDISALANSAALYEKSCAYMVWGIHDETHEIIGSTHTLQSLKKGNQEIENWLRDMLSKNADFEFHSVTMNNVTVNILIIQKATHQTVSYKKMDYIRIGSYTKKLSEYPEMQAQLWDKLRSSKFEERLAKQDLDLNAVLNYIQYDTYFELKQIPIPSEASNIIHYLLEEGIIIKQDNSFYSITNMGAILFAKKLSDFPRLSRKSVRVIQYDGTSRIKIKREDIGNKGYAVGFEGLLKYIEALLPAEENIVDGLRQKKTAFPSIAIREIVANALIHQDFSITGSGPTVEIFDKRIEITNPGVPLIDIKRIIDNPPRSRNERLAELMRRLRICEELGSGWDKITLSCEIEMLPTPRIDLYEESTKITLFSEKSFNTLSQEDKLWACYTHACVKQIQGEQISNKTIRKRFGLNESSSASASRLIKEAVESKLIKPLDPTTAPRYMKYIPYWA